MIAEGTLQELIQETVGANRRATFTLASTAPQLDGFRTNGDPHELTAEIRDVAAELPKLLERIRESGAEVLDVEVQAPSLHSVFIHLTGRELRE